MIHSSIFPARRLSAALLALILLTGALPAGASAINYEQQYDFAIGLMYNLRDTERLSNAADMFAQLGAYRLSSYYQYYIQVVIKLQTEDEADIRAALDMLPLLSANEQFTDELEQHSLSSCASLRQYGETRLLEIQGRYTDAMAAYQQTPVLDALDRAIRLIPLAREEAEQRRAAEEAARAEAERQAAEEAAKAEAERKAAEEAARQEAERKAAEEAARREAERKAAEESARKTVRAGDVVTFGHYEQDGMTSNGQEPIRWRVLDVSGDQAFLLSVYALDCRPFHESNARVSWQRCGLREWLNGTFFRAAFSAEEQRAVVTTLVDNSRGQGYAHWTLGDTAESSDRVFLLSYAEAWKYLPFDQDRCCGATAYAVSQGCEPSAKYQADGRPTCMWWLRSPGQDIGSAAGVKKFGPLDFFMYQHIDVGVRPAIRVIVSAL